MEVQAQDQVRVERQPALLVVGQVGAEGLAHRGQRPRQVQVVVDGVRESSVEGQASADSGARGSFARS